MLGMEYDERDRQRMRCVVENNAPLTVSRLFVDGDKEMFAMVQVDATPSCIGVMFTRDLRLGLR